MPFTLFQILAVLRPGPTDAPALLDALRRLAAPSDVPSLPAFYRHLRQGVDEGWIEIDGTASSAEGPGRPRQRYALTRAGVHALEHRARELSPFTRLAFGRGDGGTP